jgi:hypothetical protein
VANTFLRSAGLAAAALLVLGTGLAVGADTAADDAHAAGTAGTPVTSATPAPRAAASPVGALFADGRHSCTASVVHSDAGDLVLTAAHCVTGERGTGTEFAPGYHDGVAPFGMWAVTGVAVADGWTSAADPDLDFAFLTVHQGGNTASVESLAGANTLGIDRGFDHRITLTGYPGSSDSPVVCTGSATRSDTFQQRVACPGFPDGTSGGPWVTDTDPATGRGTVVGVIGGYQLGGDTPDVSYSAYFDDDIRNLYAAATR